MPRSAHPKIFAIIIDSWLSCCQVHHRDVRAFLYPFEHDLAAVGRDIEVADDDVATELRELAPIPRREIEGPEVLCSISPRKTTSCAGGTLRTGTRGVRRAQYVPQEGERGLLRDDGRAAADRGVCPDGLPGRPRGVDSRASRFRAVDVRRRSRKVPDERRGAGRHHAVLADEQRGLVSAELLGERRTEPYQCGRAEDCRDLAAGGDHGIPGGRLSPPGDMGPARLSQPDLLSRGRQGRSLRGLGTAATLRCGDPSGVQVTAGSGWKSGGALIGGRRNMGTERLPVFGCPLT